MDIFANVFHSGKDSLRSYLSSDSYILITGCTSGIGLQFSHTLASLGFNLVLVARNPLLLRELTDQLKQANPSIRLHPIIQDMSARDASENIMLALEQAKLEIGVLINNAGLNTRGFFRDTSVDDLRDMALVNTYPYTLLTRGLLPHFRQRG